MAVRIWLNRNYATTVHVIEQLRDNPDRVAVEIFASHTDPSSPVLSAADHVLSEPDGDDAEYVDQLLASCRRHRIDVLLAVGRQLAIARRRFEFEAQGTALICPPAWAIDTLDDKAATYRSLSGSAIVPEWRVVNSRDIVRPGLRGTGRRMDPAGTAGGQAGAWGRCRGSSFPDPGASRAGGAVGAGRPARARRTGPRRVARRRGGRRADSRSDGDALPARAGDQHGCTRRQGLGRGRGAAEQGRAAAAARRGSGSVPGDRTPGRALRARRLGEHSVPHLSGASGAAGGQHASLGWAVPDRLGRREPALGSRAAGSGRPGHARSGPAGSGVRHRVHGRSPRRRQNRWIPPRPPRRSRRRAAACWPPRADRIGQRPAARTRSTTVWT